MYTLKWSVLQYVIVRPLASIAGIICEAYGVLCEAAGFDYHWANVYIGPPFFICTAISHDGKGISLA